MLLSLRRRGQLLLAISVLVGVVVGASLGMVARAEPPSVLAAPARERAAPGAAASASGSPPSEARAALPRPRAGDGPSGRHTVLADRADRHQQAGKHGKHKPGKQEPGKDKRKG